MALSGERGGVAARRVARQSRAPSLSCLWGLISGRRSEGITVCVCARVCVCVCVCVWCVCVCVCVCTCVCV